MCSRFEQNCCVTQWLDGAARRANQKQFRRSDQASGHWTTLPRNLVGRLPSPVAAAQSPTAILRQPKDTPSLSLRDIIHEFGHDVQ